MILGWSALSLKTTSCRLEISMVGISIFHLFYRFGRWLKTSTTMRSQRLRETWRKTRHSLPTTAPVLSNFICPWNGPQVKDLSCPCTCISITMCNVGLWCHPCILMPCIDPKDERPRNLRLSLAESWKVQRENHVELKPVWGWIHEWHCHNT